MAFDRGRGVLVLWDHGCGRLVMGFTGGCAARVNQTWTWDGGRWSAQPTRSTPMEVGPGAMVYDSRLRRVVYVSGTGLAWTWTGSDWTPLAMSGAPRVPGHDTASGATTFAAGYDEGRELLVFALSASTWTWAGIAWTQVPARIDGGEAPGRPHLGSAGAPRHLRPAGGRSPWT